MKVALSGMILGASMLGAHATPISSDMTDVKFGTGNALTFNNGILSITGGGTLDCKLATDKGTAGHYYAVDDFEKGKVHTKVGDYKAGSTLAYWCGLSGLGYTGSGPTQQPGEDRVLVHFTGSAQTCAGTVVSTMHQEGTLGARVYAPQIATTVTYDCIEEHGFDAPTATADIEIQATQKAEDEDIMDEDQDGKAVVAPTTSAVVLERSTTDGKVYSKTWTASFDLGTAQPHRGYYELESACTGGILCFGKLTTNAAGDTQDLGTVLSSNSAAEGEAPAWSTDSQVEYFGLESADGSTSACNVDPYIQEQTTTQFGACGMTKKKFYGEQGLLTELKCPFKDNSVSTETLRDACVAAGTAVDVPNTCNDRFAQGQNGYNAEDPLTLSNGFVAKLQFPDTGGLRFRTPAVTYVNPGSKTYQPGQTTLQWVVSVGGDFAGATTLTVDVAGDVQTVDASGGSITLSVPVGVNSVTLKGHVFTSCTSDNIDLATIPTASSSSGAIASGHFEVKGNVCDRRFVFKPATGLTETTFEIDSIYHGDRTVSIAFCDNDKTASDCRKNAAGMVTTKDSRHAIISKACEGVRAGDSGGLVRFKPDGTQIYQYAPIKCGGTCETDGLKDITLDWGITLVASVVDENNQFSALQSGAAYEGLADSLLKRTAYLVQDNDNFGCNAQGTMVGDVPTEPKCTLGGTNSITSADDIRKLFKDCGTGNLKSAQAKIVQLLHVDAEGANDDLRFCNSKSLSLEIKPMTGTSYDAIAISASSEDAVARSIFVSFDTIQYKKCTAAEGGGYKLISSVNVDSTEIDDSWTFDHTSDKAVYKTGEKAGDQIIFTSNCKNVCDGAGFTGTIPIGGKISWASGDDNAELTFDVDTEVIGDPCPKDDEVTPGSVVLELYSVPVTESDGNPGSCQSSTEQSVAHALDDKLCAKLTPSGFGNAGLQVTRELLQRVPSDMIDMDSPTFDFVAGAVPQVITHDFFEHDDNLVRTNGVHKSADAKAHGLLYDDAFTSYRLEVDWYQQLSQRRLRSVHVFGAGDHESLSTVMILPPSAQIEDAVESLDAHETQGETTTAAPDAAEKDEGLSGGAIVGIIAGGVVVAGGLVYVAMQASGSGVSFSVRRPKKKEYTPVRRSERFSTMNF